MKKIVMQPFLWNFVQINKENISQSGGQERPLTATVSEENSPCMTKFI